MDECQVSCVVCVKCQMSMQSNIKLSCIKIYNQKTYARIPSIAGCKMVRTTVDIVSAVTRRDGQNAPIPPVLRPYF